MPETLEQRILRRIKELEKFREKLSDEVKERSGPEIIHKRVLIDLLKDIRKKKILVKGGVEMHFIMNLPSEYISKYREPESTFLQREPTLQRELNPLLRESRVGVISYDPKTYEIDWDFTDYTS